MASPAPRPEKTRIAFIDIGRALGALLVVYSHIHVVWMYLDHGISSRVTDALTDAFAGPLHLVGQDLGQIGVPFFFLASGFVVSPIALRQGHGRFAVNRFFRIYPLLGFVILVAAGALLLGLKPIETGPRGPLTPWTVLANMTLANFVIHPQTLLLGVTWTLAVEVVFYLMLIVLLPVLRRATWLGIGIELAVIALVMATHGWFGPSYGQLAFTVSLVTLPIFGQIIWAGHVRRIPPWLAGGFLLVTWCLFVWAKDHQLGTIESGYPTAVTIAVLLFLVGLFAEDRLPQRRAWTYLSERTYSIYLMHGITVFIVLDALYRLVPLWLAVLSALAVTAIAVEISYRLVERPTAVLGRRLSRRGSRPTGGTHRARHAESPTPEAARA